MNFTVPHEFDGKTVKQYITQKLRLSGKMITRLKQREQGIMLNGSHVTVRAVLREDDILHLALEQEDRPSDKIKPAKIPLDILHEDDHYIFLNKSAGVPTHPSHDHYDDTLANGLAYLYSQRGLTFVCRAVNRLDKDTSGIVVFAKSAASANEFSKLQQSKLITKKYIALLDGVLTHGGSVKGYIRRKDNSIMLREFSQERMNEDSSFSHTDYNPLCSSTGNTLTELLLHTGRTHQIRVHMAHLGHPVTGDGLYGEEQGMTRHMLHAYTMSFVHPFTGKQTFLTAPLPTDFQTVLDEKGIYYDLK